MATDTDTDTDNVPTANVNDSDGVRQEWWEQFGFTAGDLEEVEIAAGDLDIPTSAAALDSDPALQFALSLAAETPEPLLPRVDSPTFDDGEWQRWINTDIPPDDVSLDELLPMVMATAGLEVELGLEQDANANIDLDSKASEVAGAGDSDSKSNSDSRVVAAALQTIGIEVREGLNLDAAAYSLALTSTDTEEAGPPMYLVPGVLSTATADGEQRQALLLLLEETDAGERMQAMAVPFGALGSPELAGANWETLRDTLYGAGPDQAFEVMRDLDNQQRPIEQPAIQTVPPPQIETPEQSESELGIGIDIDL